MNTSTPRQSKYKIGDIVKHKLGFPIVITSIETYSQQGYTEKTITVRKGWPWKRYDAKKVIQVPNFTVEIFNGRYYGRIWVSNQQPDNVYFREEELE